jgi:transposase
MKPFLLWREYRERRSEGHSDNQFCARCGACKGRVPVVMRLSHRAVEKLFVGQAGQTAAVIGSGSNVPRMARIFVAVLGLELDLYRGNPDADAPGLDRSAGARHRLFSAACPR